MQLKNDLGSVIRFRNELTVISADLEDNRRSVESNVEELNETWNDSKFQEFNARFEEENEFVKRLIENINDFNDSYLYNTQRALEGYLY